MAALTSAALTASTWAATDDQHGSHHPAPTAAIQVAQAQPGSPGMGMRAGATAPATAPGYADQMKAMQQMHDKMVAAKTPEERNALMAEQMKLMQSGMNMMGGMGGGMGAMGAGATAGKPADMAARQGMMEQRMDMMQSMMQMMMDRMPPVPATK
ncbi:MAG: hypothetical protein Q8N44_01490 [Rubrivivax sp.]|nr:hypothetical protein [Rubrivivax sp.]MDP3082350.1 hypothetical protein [Rubrivivax sp.]